MDQLTSGIYLGVDVGSSGVRCVALDERGQVVAKSGRSFADAAVDPRATDAWARLSDHVIRDVAATVGPDAVRAIAVDGTSGTILATDAMGEPVAPALMYNDTVSDDQVLDRIAAHAPADSVARGATSALAKALVVQERPNVARLMHQADWISARLSGRFDVSDENNALKTGYDPVNRCWGDWIGRTGLRMALLPSVVPAGTRIGTITGAAADRLGLSPLVQVVAGTTDGCASFFATGAHEIGDAVTALGSSLTVKLLSDRPINAPAHGIYSHRIPGGWLVGGASNTGGRVLASFFTPKQLADLSHRIDPHRPTTLDYYPLPCAGERFPVADPALQPRMSPRPADDAEFLHGLLQGIAAIEAQGYARLAAMGSPELRSVRSVGGGAGNAVWTAIRARLLDVPFLDTLSDEAAAGVASLARRSCQPGLK